MTGYLPLKKFLLSVFCAFLLIIYVPVACVVGNDLAKDVDFAQAETNSFCEEELTEEPSSVLEDFINNNT